MNAYRSRRAISDDPNFVHPDALDHPKRITLHRADAAPPAQNQTVVVHPDETEGHSTAPKPGPTAHHAMKVAYIPAGHVLISPKTGEALAGEDYLYDHVKDGDTVEVVKA